MKWKRQRNGSGIEVKEKRSNTIGQMKLSNTLAVLLRREMSEEVGGEVEIQIT